MTLDSTRHWSIQTNLTGRRPLEWIIVWICAGQRRGFHFLLSHLSAEMGIRVGYSQKFGIFYRSFGSLQPVSSQCLSRLYVWKPAHTSWPGIPSTESQRDRKKERLTPLIDEINSHSKQTTARLKQTATAGRYRTGECIGGTDGLDAPGTKYTTGTRW